MGSGYYVGATWTARRYYVGKTSLTIEIPLTGRAECVRSTYVVHICHVEQHRVRAAYIRSIIEVFVFKFVLRSLYIT